MYSTVRETGPSFERRPFAVPMSEICLWREEFRGQRSQDRIFLSAGSSGSQRVLLL